MTALTCSSKVISEVPSHSSEEYLNRIRIRIPARLAASGKYCLLKFGKSFFSRAHWRMILPIEIVMLQIAVHQLGRPGPVLAIVNDAVPGQVLAYGAVHQS